MARLNTHVHVRDSAGVNHVFGPDSTIPAWAVEAITNTDVWEKVPTNTAAPSPAAPPLAGKGSGLGAWQRHAESVGVTVPKDATRQDIITLVGAAS